MKKIGFIGVGVMGKSMARNLMKNGFEVAIYTRTKSKVEDVIAEGAQWCDTVQTCSQGRDAVITMVGYPKDVEEVYFSDTGILNSAAAGTVVIDMTTTDPDISVRIYEKAKQKGIQAIDAPVSGGDVGAQNATLSIMAGGDRDTFDAVRPVFEAMGKTIVYEGGAGTGQHTKMANQIALAGAVAGVCEAMTYAQKVGLDVQTMLDSISQGAAGSWQMSNMAPRMMKDDFDPGFFVKHYIKDMTIASGQAERAGAELGVLDVVLGMYKQLEEQGMGDLGTQALLKYYEE